MDYRDETCEKLTEGLNIKGMYTAENLVSAVTSLELCIWKPRKHYYYYYYYYY
jgi:hypothetical protein